jgi:hypothetical protein
MRWFQTAVVASMSALLPAVASADPFDAKRVPADSKWLLHADVDAARGTKIWDMLNQKLTQDPSYASKVEEVAQFTGMHFPEDFHDVTLFGKSAADDAGVVVIHGKMDRDKTMATLQANPSYGTTSYANYQILNWDDKGIKNFGAFHDGDLAIIGRSAAIVENSLDTLDGKGASLKADSALAVGAQAKVLLYGAARDLASLKKDNQPQSPVAQQIETVWVSLSEKENTALVQANVVALTPDAAAQMQATLDGVRAMVNLASGGDNADPNAKAAAAALATLTAKLTDRTIHVEWPIPLDIIKGLVEKK